MRFHVIGIGPIGTLIAHHLRITLPRPHSVVLIHKKPRWALKAEGFKNSIKIELDGILQTSRGFISEVFKPTTKRLHPLPKSFREKHILVKKAYRPYYKTTADIESLIVTTKAYSVVPAIEALLPRLKPSSTIVLLNNGMGVYEELLEKVFRNPKERPHFIVASNTNGAWTKGYFHTVHAGVGSLTFGITGDPNGRDFEASFNARDSPFEDRPLSLDDIARADEEGDARYLSLRNTVAALSGLRGLGAKWQPISRVVVALKRKLVVNSVINPLTALMDCRNGDVFETEASRRIMQRVCAEAATAFALQAQEDDEGYQPTCTGVNSEIKERLNRVRMGLSRVSPALRAKALEEECLSVARLTKHNTSSMLADVRGGSHTEIDFMNGYLVGIGRAYKVNMHVTATLLNLIRMRTAIPMDRARP
ncbi:hypothetical protein BV25DRAFT_518848 [Artomyces pyxidatus]|uniref:Uncharacterized protein n=1 Tax=Artomyces pyxidatus TaxID=48021 RepID=A0ACB8TI33_9AGAM|nr:hypothetical protein BV25DRAFT_518848 [Artomyces pyxidatus]